MVVKETKMCCTYYMFAKTLQREMNPFFSSGITIEFSELH